MAAIATGTVSLVADTSEFSRTLRVIVKHMTALANELDPPEPVEDSYDLRLSEMTAQRAARLASIRGEGN